LADKVAFLVYCLVYMTEIEIRNCFGYNQLFWFCKIFAELNKNINKTEITKIETINNQIDMLKSGSIQNNCYFHVKSTRLATFGPIWTRFRFKYLKFGQEAIFDSIRLIQLSQFD